LLLLTAEIVQDDGIAGTKGRQENLLDIDPEADVIESSVKNFGFWLERSEPRQ
jgi:hypothetical protein